MAAFSARLCDSAGFSAGLVSAGLVSAGLVSAGFCAAPVAGGVLISTLLIKSFGQLITSTLPTLVLISLSLARSIPFDVPLSCPANRPFILLNAVVAPCWPMPLAKFII